MQGAPRFCQIRPHQFLGQNATNSISTMFDIAQEYCRTLFAQCCCSKDHEIEIMQQIQILRDFYVGPVGI
jgi:hypothetical protein